MIWQEKVLQIIMLCRLTENNKIKCVQYWPPKVGESMQMTYGLIITCMKIDQTNPNFVYTKLSLICILINLFFKTN